MNAPNRTALPLAMIENRTFGELVPGESASLVRLVTDDDVRLFAATSGDVNPAHLDPEYAATDPFGHVVIHGMWTAAQISTVLGTKLPGPGTIYLGQDLRFRRPVAPGDTITTHVTVREKRDEKNIVLFDTRCVNQHGDEVLTGTATVIAPTEKLILPRMPVPHVTLNRRGLFDAYLQRARELPPLRTGVVHPCSAEAIEAAIEARNEGLIEPVLFGPTRKIQAAAAAAGVSLDGIEMIEAAHSHDSAAKAIAAAARNEIKALMKGSLHSDE
jgi:phosphate acetyltransferase